MRSGHVVIKVGCLGNVGNVGYGWMLSAAAKHYGGTFDPSAYSLDYNISDVYASAGPYYRYYGFPLRWVGVNFVFG